MKFGKELPITGRKTNAERPAHISDQSAFDVDQGSQTERKDRFELEEKGVDQLENEEIVMRWQEKLFSEREFAYYSDPLNCVTSLEKRYHEEILNIKR